MNARVFLAIASVVACCAVPLRAQQRQQRSQPSEREAQRSARLEGRAPTSDRTRSGTPQVRRNPQAPAPKVPKGFPLSAKDEARVDEVLGFWEQTTGSVSTFECRFRKLDFDGVFGVRQNGKLLPKTQSVGMLRYKKPDMGLYQVEKVYELIPPKKDEKPNFKELKNAGERWVCDGSTVYEYDYRQKQLIQTNLPAEMRGQAITNGPLPFMFGASAAEMKRRYWIRELNPPEHIKNQFWLEAYPKRRSDAANFKRIVLFIDEAKFLPVAMRVDERNGKSYASYQFTNRKINSLGANFAGMIRTYIPKNLPAGWRKVNRDFADSSPQASRTRNSVQRRVSSNQGSIQRTAKSRQAPTRK